ncbi:MAG TPA: [acyl-carrier-protein] S-malonyltransferase [Eggerthellaceae bacterium]|nr:[acyl-carrier-protein] S-malonyltransferase [Eggerthellaceae bacterium]
MGKTAFLFSGQGAQFPGMMKEYHDSIPAARRVFDVADASLGRSISDLCFEGPKEQLDLTHNTQPCVLAADLAAYEAALAAGFSPDGLAGFSLGEYAALVASECLPLSDAFPLVQLRADAMQDAVPVGQGAMAAVMKVGLEDLQAMCDEVDGYVQPANVNSPAQIVVSGRTEAVEALVALCKSRKVRAMKIPVSVPSHCALMTPAADALSEALAGVSLGEPALPVYMNVTAAPAADASEASANMVAQLTSPVLWRQTLERLWADGFTRFLECGPGATLSGFVKKTLPEAEILSLETR